MAATSDLLVLRAGGLEAALVPGIGGSLAWLRRAGADVMRPLSEERRAAGDVLGTAMFPMMPIANRIAGNAFRFGGALHEVAPNNPPERFHVHGDAWRRPWAVAEARSDRATLVLEGGGGPVPHRYRAWQAFALEPEALSVRLAMENSGPVPMPFGMGLHPWFPRDPDVTLRFRACRFHLEEPDHVSGDAVTLPPELDFADDRPLPGSWRNNGYGGWDGEAALRFPSRKVRLRMRADPVFGHLMLYADPARPFFCLEPQTNASGALNRPGGIDDPRQGVVVLGPGARMEGTVRFEVEALP